MWKTFTDQNRFCRLVYICDVSASMAYVTCFITPILKSLVVPVIWLVLIGAIYSRIAPFFASFFPVEEEATLKTKQPIRIQGLFKVTDQIAGRWKTWRIMWQILQLLFPKLLFFPPKKWINLIWNWLSIVVTKYLKSCIWAISKWM